MTIEAINKKLIDNYGYSNKGIEYPRFRVVFSDTQFEKRVFKTDFYFEGLQVSSGTKIEEVPKYPFVKGKHVFEIHCPTDNEEIADKGGNYEPLWTFEDAEQRPLPVEWDMVEYLCQALNAPVIRKTQKDIDDEENKHIEKAAAEEYAMIDNNSPYLATMLNNKEAVFLDSTKVMK